jgi:hypothetical protein
VQLPLFSCAARAGPHEKRRPQPRRRAVELLLVMPPTRRDEATQAKLDAFARESATHQSHDWTLTSPRNVLFNFPPDAWSSSNWQIHRLSAATCNLEVPGEYFR